MCLYLITRRKQGCAVSFFFILYSLTQKATLLSRFASRCINRPFIFFSPLCLQFFSSIVCFLDITGAPAGEFTLAWTCWRWCCPFHRPMAFLWRCLALVARFQLHFPWPFFMCFCRCRGGSASSKPPFHCYSWVEKEIQSTYTWGCFFLNSFPTFFHLLFFFSENWKGFKIQL